MYVRSRQSGPGRSGHAHLSAGYPRTDARSCLEGVRRADDRPAGRLRCLVVVVVLDQQARRIERRGTTGGPATLSDDGRAVLEQRRLAPGLVHVHGHAALREVEVDAALATIDASGHDT